MSELPPPHCGGTKDILRFNIYLEEHGIEPLMSIAKIVPAKTKKSGKIYYDKTKTERKVFMKTLKLILGIISFILSAFVLFQSCAAGIGNALENNGEAGGAAGVILAICCIVGR